MPSCSQRSARSSQKSAQSKGPVIVASRGKSMIRSKQREASNQAIQNHRSRQREQATKPRTSSQKKSKKQAAAEAVRRHRHRRRQQLSEAREDIAKLEEEKERSHQVNEQIRKEMDQIKYYCDLMRAGKKPPQHVDMSDFASNHFLETLFSEKIHHSSQ